MTPVKSGVVGPGYGRNFAEKELVESRKRRRPSSGATLQTQSFFPKLVPSSSSTKVVRTSTVSAMQLIVRFLDHKHLTDQRLLKDQKRHRAYKSVSQYSSGRLTVTLAGFGTANVDSEISRFFSERARVISGELSPAELTAKDLFHRIVRAIVRRVAFRGDLQKKLRLLPVTVSFLSTEETEISFGFSDAVFVANSNAETLFFLKVSRLAAREIKSEEIDEKSFTRAVCEKVSEVVYTQIREL